MKQLNVLLLGMILPMFLLTSCNDDPDIDCTTFAEDWGYEGDVTPDVWEFCEVECGGAIQSPVNITGSVADGALTALGINYNNTPVNIINNGHTLEFEYEAGSELTINGEVYTLKQFHVHTASEHTIGGERFPMEVHLVHTKGSAYVVVSVLFEEGAENPFFDGFINNLPIVEGDSHVTAEELNVVDLLPVDQGYYNYGGSLTTPPCSEAVSWYIMKNRVTASTAQLQTFSDILKSNYRPIQELNGREIKEFN